MRILIVSDAWYPQLNGVVRTYEYLQRELQDMGYTVRVIGPGDFPYTFPMPGYGEIRLTLFPYNRLRRMIESFAPTVLHIATEGPLGLAARKYAAEYGIEFTSCYHTHFPDYAAQRAAKFLPFLFKPVRSAAIRFLRWFHAISSCLFVATPSLERTITAWNFACPIKRMTRGIDHALFFPGEAATSPCSSLPRPVALYVGRVAIEKNLDAFCTMDWTGSKVVIGHGPDLEDMRQKYPDVIFKGAASGSALADYYRDADVFVFPSKTDTFGMVLIEALACGLPVAAYPVTGPVDIITAPGLGALDNDLAAAARAALTQGTPEERAMHAREHYSWRRAAHQFLETD